MTVEVTLRDIQGAIPQSHKNCPIARAIRRQRRMWRRLFLPSVIAVGPRHVVIDTHLTSTVYRLPEHAQDFIRVFDSYFPVHPITFKMRRQ